ncbi:MAG: ribonuclease PH [Chloroflexi bacterium]|nr:MAG: ribonuclease PH [Anaerolineaceae bacterium 4572_32.1]RLC73872.1 MAG: ribonuclease PH [Chloroflexota bacterium]RLC77947.1 MAG: ribonuclease PH [Chloroflexota bacterium]HEY73369.1 ribonuclease PH [Thermoflexia bacterium]
MINHPQRPDGRRCDELRPVTFTLDYVEYAEGSVLIEAGHTRVLCNVSIEEQTPTWMTGRGTGWLTAEYAMLPRSTHTRSRRETDGLRGRTQEIRRLIGRSLRAGVDLDLLGERVLIVDCDVLQADGGTRTAAITGGYVAVALALRRLAERGMVPPETLKPPVAAISVGLVNGEVRADLCYAEDRDADVDLNVVMTEDGRLIEVQGTAEGAPFSRETLNRMLDAAAQSIAGLIQQQHEVLT